MADKSPYIFSKSVEIKTGLEKLFQFHLDTNNLPEISPPFPKAELKSISEIPLKEGSEVTVSLSFLLFKTDWEIEIERVKENHLIVDLQKKGLFEYWRHSHIFEKIDDKVIMTDKVEYVPPFGQVGKLFNPFIRLQLQIMFNYRHKKTKRLFEK